MAGCHLVLIIVFPFFRPISLYEIEDDYRILEEIKESHPEDEFMDQMILFIDAFRDSLTEKSTDPLVEYFLLNHGDNSDVIRFRMCLMRWMIL